MPLSGILFLTKRENTLKKSKKKEAKHKPPLIKLNVH
jgi:hypothetical protein